MSVLTMKKIWRPFLFLLGEIKDVERTRILFPGKCKVNICRQIEGQ